MLFHSMSISGVIYINNNRKLTMQNFNTTCSKYPPVIGDDCSVYVYYDLMRCTTLKQNTKR